ncbi:hypothetical protein BJ741DRAFT_714429 [Chytriomyces cf. hyalinus JEL632]|nr:hypothetical protein BJ741DRAFT_714429 [Chytriomyces cf. hyalinus JEL632]
MKSADLDTQMNADVIVSTYNFLCKGISIWGLSSICFASPKKDVVQSLGRIYRKIHSVRPLVLDILDTPLCGQERTRIEIYKTELYGNVTILSPPPNSEAQPPQTNDLSEADDAPAGTPERPNGTS